MIAYRDVLKTPTEFPRSSAIALNRLETSNWDLIAAIAGGRQPGALDELAERLREMTGRAHIFFAPSARCAIAQVLSALPQTEVVIPAWTCAAVKQAVQVAGKRIICVDIDENSVNATLAQYAKEALPGRVLVPTHLFGIPTNIAQICELARDTGCLTLEDAAAAYPARIGSRLLGTFGDFGVISFERSKRVPSFHGAAIVVNNDTAVNLTGLGHAVVPTSRVPPIRELLFSLVHNFGTIPWFYGRVTVPRTLRSYKSQPDESAAPCPVEATSDPLYRYEFHPYQAALVSRVLSRIDAIRGHISRLVEIYQRILGGSPIKIFVPTGCDRGGLLRFPIAFPGRDRTEVLRAALRRGLFLETNFERPVPDWSDHASFPNSHWAAENIVLLPLYSGLSADAAAKLAFQIIEIEKETAA